MNRYKVLVGTHLQDQQEYKAGDVVISGIDLLACFPNKFQLLGPVEEPKFVTNPAPCPPAPQRPLAPRPPAANEDEEEAETSAKTEKVKEDPDEDEDDDVVRKPAAKIKHAAHKTSKSE